MTPVLVALAVIAVGGAIAATSAREPRVATLGMLVVLLASAYVTEPMPTLTATAARLLGAVLAGYLVWVALRPAPRHTGGPPFGWTGAAALATVAFAAGWLATSALGEAFGAVPSEGPSGGVPPALASQSPVAQAAIGAAFALVALAAGPVLVGRDVLRLGLGLLLLLGSVELFGGAMAGPPSDETMLAYGILIATTGAALAALVARSLRLHGDLVLRATSAREAAVRSRVVDEAHPLGPPE